MILYPLVAFLPALFINFNGVDGAPIPEDGCTSISLPDIPGLTIHSVKGTVQTNFSVEAFPLYPFLNPTPIYDLHFCDVQITVTQYRLNDITHITVYLPFSDWNGRFQGQGGGGYTTELRGLDGKLFNLARAVSQGFAAASTDGGHGDDAENPSTWALNEEHEADLALLVNFASRSLHDMTVVGKAVTAAFYGREADYAYFSGCSTAGRQGFALAQQYPSDYNGINVITPALYYPGISVSGQLGQVLMEEAGVFPTLCEFQAILDATIEACDGLDGVVDGVIDNPSQCSYDPHQLVGTFVSCGNDQNVTISKTAADVVTQLGQGPRTQSGGQLWYGLNPGTDLSSLVNSTTFANGSVVGNPNPLANNWIKYFVQKDPDFDTSTITTQSLEQMFNQSRLEYDTVAASDNPDLSLFRAVGGKLISWQGLTDAIIPPNGSTHYRENVKRVMGNDSVLDEFFRYFSVPGVGHCGTGPGPIPDSLTAIIEWVEKGTAPDVLPAVATDVTGNIRHRDICRYPLSSKYDGVGDPTLATSYSCVDT